MGLDTMTPGYMVREELKRRKMKLRAEKRAWVYEERVREGKGDLCGKMSKRDRGESEKWTGEIGMGKGEEFLEGGGERARERRRGRYWLGAEENRCRVCKGEEADWEHVLSMCEGKEREGDGIGEKVRRVLDAEG
ncbi:hypothetical protein WN55_08610 [Dufourea novaeangliae]|uniref:Uncharacterized protein n=1 Tax=Dufourea novaeangliae TaxID=178035 RepID=A0A154PT05_DUFNO|nr:hypothetical protein WN55_08610 [Dufourea novaeangliae]